MKFSKLLSLVAGIAMVTSFVTANAAKNENPVASVEVGTVTSAGKAAIDIYFQIDADPAFAAYAETEDEETLEMVYTGKGMDAIQVTMNLNPEIFDVSTVAKGTTNIGTGTADAAAGTYDITFAATKAIDWCLQGGDGKVKLGRFTAMLKDTSITKEQLAAMADLVDFTAFNVRVKEYPAAGAAESNGYEQTYYRLDGAKCDFIPAVIEGAEIVTPPAPTASVAISAAKKTTDAAWIAEKGNTMFWGVDFANGGFNGTAVAKIFSDAKERELTIATPAGAEINGEASFGVFVIVGDSTDAIGLTITSGDVTATAAPVAYADAE